MKAKTSEQERENREKQTKEMLGARGEGVGMKRMPFRLILGTKKGGVARREGARGRQQGNPLHLERARGGRGLREGKVPW